MAYSALSHAKSCAKLQLLNINCEHIKVNATTLIEMKGMRGHAVLTWQKALETK